MSRAWGITLRGGASGAVTEGDDGLMVEQWTAPYFRKVFRGKRVSDELMRLQLSGQLLNWYELPPASTEQPPLNPIGGPSEMRTKEPAE